MNKDPVVNLLVIIFQWQASQCHKFQFGSKKQTFTDTDNDTVSGFVKKACKGQKIKWTSLYTVSASKNKSVQCTYIQHCMDLQLAVDPYKKRVLFESMDWLPKTHRVCWHISANQISTKHSPTAASWYEEWGLPISQKSDIWYKNWSPFCLFLDFRNGAFWQLD